MAFSLDNKRLACLSSENVSKWVVNNGGSGWSGSSRGIYVWDIQKNNINFHLPLESSSSSSPIVISSDGTKLVTTDRSNTTYLWDLKTEELIHTLPVDGYNLVLSNDAKYLAVKEFSDISIWDLTTGIIKRNLGARVDRDSYTGIIKGADGFALAFSPDASILCVASVIPIHSKSIDEVDLIDIATGRNSFHYPDTQNLLKF